MNDTAVVGLDGCAEPGVDAERVAAARQRMLGDDRVQEVADVFRLLGDPGRVRVLYALLEAGEVCSGTALSRGNFVVRFCCSGASNRRFGV